MRSDSALGCLLIGALTFVGCEKSVDMPICAIDMGSNSFRRILGSFADGRYQQHALEVRTLGVGDDLARHGRISESKLAEIGAALSAFKAACDRDAAGQVVAVGTSAFRDAPNGSEVVAAAAARGIAMEIASEARESELAYLVASLGEHGLAVVDNGSRSIELVTADGGSYPHRVFNLGYRVAYQRFFQDARDPNAAVEAFRAELQQTTSDAAFMRGKRALVGVEFGEMVDVLFPAAAAATHVLTLTQLQQRLAEIIGGGAGGFAALKQTPDIDRALPRLVVAAFTTETFGYSEIALTRRELGTGLIIEAGLEGRRR